MGKNNLFFLLFFLIFSYCSKSQHDPNSDNFKIVEFGPHGENVSTDSSIFTRFSGKATDFSFSITPPVKLIPYYYDDGSNLLKLVPENGLEFSTRYYVFVEAKSANSNSRASVMWSFQTVARPLESGPQIELQKGCFKDKLIFNISTTGTVVFSVYVNSNLVKRDTIEYGSRKVLIEQGFVEGENELIVELINIADKSRIKYTINVTKDTVPPEEPEIIKISRAEFLIKEPKDSGCGVEFYNLYQIDEEGKENLLGAIREKDLLFDTYFMVFQKSKICIKAVDKAYNESKCSNVEEQGFERLSINFGSPVSYPVVKNTKLFLISEGKLFVYDGKTIQQTDYSCDKISGLPQGNIACQSQNEVYIINMSFSKKLYSGQLVATCDNEFAISDGKSVRVYDANFEIKEEISIEGVESIECIDIDKDGEVELIMGIPREDKIYFDRLNFNDLSIRTVVLTAGEGNISIHKGAKFGSFIEGIEKPEPKIFILVPELDLKYILQKIQEAEGQEEEIEGEWDNLDLGNISGIFVISPYSPYQPYEFIYGGVNNVRKFKLFEGGLIFWLANNNELYVSFHTELRWSMDNMLILENVLDIAVGDIDGDGVKDFIATTQNSVEIFK